MKRKWFWIALMFWVVFTCTVIAWAIIYSPVRLDPRVIGEFETNVNGLKQKNNIWVNEGRLNDLLPLVIQNFKKEGWAAVGKNMDLTPALLGTVDKSSQLSEHLLIKVFQKKGFYKTLGLWEPVDDDKTFGFVCEVPDSVFNPAQARAHWDFPFAPPPAANSLYSQKLKNIQIALISLPRQNESEDVFQRLCSTQGFSEKPLPIEGDKKTFVLTKQKIKILAILEVEDEQTSISMVCLEH